MWDESVSQSEENLLLLNVFNVFKYACKILDYNINIHICIFLKFQIFSDALRNAYESPPKK